MKLLVTGRVLASDGITPVPNTPVIIYKNNKPIDWVKTDISGVYLFEKIEAGGFTLTSFDNSTKETGNASGFVRANETASVDIVLGGLGVVNGAVYDSQGSPVSGAYVIGRLSYAITDNSGRYQLKSVPVGKNYLRAIDPNTGRSGNAAIDLFYSDDTAYADIYLSPVATLAGVVYERDGITPVSGAEVRIIIDTWTDDFTNEIIYRYIKATADADGRYVFANMPLNDGKYRKSTLIAVKGAEVGNTSYELLYDGQILKKDIVFIGSGKVMGTVIDEGSNNMPVGANVILNGIKPNKAGLFEYKMIGYMQSDPQTGRFSFSGAYPGRFTVTASNVFRPAPATASGIIERAGDIKDVTLILKPNSGSITGTVYQTDGITPVGADVRVTLNLGGSPVTVTTDPSGVYRFAPILPAGAYQLFVEEPFTGLKGYGSAYVKAGTEAIANLRLLGKGTVIVQVVDADGVTPVPAASVNLSMSTYPFDKASGNITAADNGQITFNNITEGGFSVSARDPYGFGGRVNGVIPADNQTVTVKIRIAPSGEVKGKFFGPDGITLIPNAQIKLISGGSVIGFDTTSTEQTMLGEYSFKNVPLGYITVEGYDPATGRYGKATGRLISDNQILNLDVSQIARGSVKGTVLTGNGQSPVDGAKVNLSVNGLYNANYNTLSYPDGSYSFPSIPAGNFSIKVSDPETNLAGNASGSLSAEGEEVEINILLQPSGTIQGVIYKADGITPAPFVNVSVSGAGGYRSATADEFGRHSFNYLPVGSYSIRAAEINGVDGGLGTARIQAEGDILTVDIKFNGFGNVSGLVYSSDGVTPAAGAEVRISVTGPFAKSYTVQTGTDGRFRFTDVPVGIFNIAVKLLNTTLGGAGSGAITANGQEINIDIRIQDSGNITGTVYKPDGTTLAEGVGVILIGTGFTLAEATDSQGRFIFENIPLGSFTLRFEDPFGNGISFHRGSLAANGQQYDAGNIILDDQAIYTAGIEPINGSANVPVSSQIKIVFSERPDLSTINSNTIKLYDNKGAVSVSLSMVDNDTAVILMPTAGLKGQTRYNLIISTGIKDLVGRSLAAQTESSFVCPVRLSARPFLLILELFF